MRKGDDIPREGKCGRRQNARPAKRVGRVKRVNARTEEGKHRSMGKHSSDRWRIDNRMAALRQMVNNLGYLVCV